LGIFHSIHYFGIGIGIFLIQIGGQMSAKFNSLIDSNGKIQKDAQNFVNERFVRELVSLLRFSETENEARVIGSILSSIVGNKVVERVAEMNKGKYDK
jgi:hypothetical protein